MVYILNSLIVPVNFDEILEVKVKLRKISVEEARDLLLNNEWTSAVGHEGTAQFLTKLLRVEIPCQRRSVFFRKGDKGLHLFLKSRLPEGVILTEEDLHKIDFWLVMSEVE